MFYVSQELFLIFYTDEKNFEGLINLSNVRTYRVDLVPVAGLRHWIVMGVVQEPSLPSPSANPVR